MERETFINKGIDYAINEYLKYKDTPEHMNYNTFLVVIIRLLVIIYDELDILTPYYLNSENSLDNNLRKFGYPNLEIQEFKSLLNQYYDEPSEHLFITIQEMVIDMLSYKKRTIDIDQKDIAQFRGLLFSEEASNPLIVSYNFFMTNKENYIINYFEESLSKNNKETKVKEKDLLTMSAYELLNYTENQIANMNADEVDEVNKKVYNYLNVNANAINRKYLVNKAVYDLNHPKPAMSTGNGYVDILFVLSIIATISLVIFVITLFIV